MLSEVSQTKANIIGYHFGILKNDANELIYKTETDSLTKKTNGYSRRKLRGGGG